jgi:hypothetical protein
MSPEILRRRGKPFQKKAIAVKIDKTWEVTPASSSRIVRI